MLEQETGKLTVLVVWEPILPSDWSRPTRPVLGRIPDSRVIQFWDENHLIAKQLSAQLHTKEPSCCRHSGTLWDLVALYPNGTRWNESEPFYIDGPVYKVKGELQDQTWKLGRLAVSEAGARSRNREQSEGSRTGARDRNRTGTSLSGLGILSLVRLPVSPPGQGYR